MRDAVARVERGGDRGLEDEPDSRREHSIGTTPCNVRAVVVITNGKAFVPQTGQDLEVIRHRDLVLGVDRPQSIGYVVIGVAGALAEGDGNEGGGRGNRHWSGGRAVVEVTGISEVVGYLPSKLRSNEQRVIDDSRSHNGGEISLIDEVPPIVRAVISVECDLGPRRVDGTRENVLIELGVGRKASAGADAQARDPVSECRHGRMN